MIPVLITLGLILLTALFVAAEFAIISASRPALEEATAHGSRRAARVLHILRDRRRKDRYIATAQLGITFASLGLGMYGEHQLATALEEPLARVGIISSTSVHTVSSVIAIGLLTYVHIVLGEMIPKTLALQHPVTTAIRVNSLIRFLNALLLPVVLLMNALGTLFLRMIGMRRSIEHEAPTQEYLRYVVEESVAEGQLDEDAGEVLTELFDFGDLTAAEVMTPRVKIVAIERGASAEELRAVLRGKRHTRYPVYEESIDHIIGFVLIRDLLDVLLEERPLPDEIIRELPYFPETSRLDHVLSLMRGEKKQIGVVIDEYGGTAGIVTIEDLFEEVVGEIADGQASRLPIEWYGSKLRALGSARLDEIGDELDRPELEHDEVDTVSGLVLYVLDRPPEVGEVIEWEGLAIRVLSVEGHGVREAEIERLYESPPEAEED